MRSSPPGGVLRALREPDAWDAWLHRLTVRACYEVARREKRRDRRRAARDADDRARWCHRRPDGPCGTRPSRAGARPPAHRPACRHRAALLRRPAARPRRPTSSASPSGPQVPPAPRPRGPARIDERRSRHARTGQVRETTGMNDDIRFERAARRRARPGAPAREPDRLVPETPPGRAPRQTLAALARPHQGAPHATLIARRRSDRRRIRLAYLLIVHTHPRAGDPRRGRRRCLPPLQPQPDDPLVWRGVLPRRVDDAARADGTPRRSSTMAACSSSRAMMPTTASAAPWPPPSPWTRPPARSPRPDRSPRDAARRRPRSSRRQRARHRRGRRAVAGCSRPPSAGTPRPAVWSPAGTMAESPRLPHRDAAIGRERTRDRRRRLRRLR